MSKCRSGHGRNPTANHVFCNCTTHNSPFWAEIETVDSGNNALKLANGCTKNFGEIGGV